VNAGPPLELRRPPPGSAAHSLRRCAALPRLAPAADRALNRIFRHDDTMVVRMADGEYDFRWLPRARPFVAKYLLRVVIGPAPAWLGLASLDAFELLGSRTAAQLPAELAAVALLDLMAPALGPIERAIGERIHLDEAHPGGAASRQRHRVHFLLRSRRSGTACWGYFQCEHDALLDKVAQAWAAHAKATVRPLDHVPVHLRFEIGQAELTMQQLRQLEVGDALRMDADGAACRPREGLGFWLRPPLRAGEDLVGVLENGRMTITEARKRIMQNDDTSGSAQPDASMHDLDSLPVTIAFDLGSRPTTIAELRELRPGCTVPLGRDVDQSIVRIVANGVLFATGQLVAVGEMLCVRITSLRDGERE
jgi:type III secretion system YscQ/HrcQ family protein